MALDFTLPQEIKSVTAGVCRCVEKEVLPLTPERHGNALVINGRKQWISNGTAACTGWEL